MTDFRQYSDIEFRSPEEILRVQNDLLKRHLRYCSERSPYYREVIKKAGLATEGLTIEGLSQLPTTGKEDLERDGDSFLAVEPDKIVDIVFSSGTTGRPTQIAYTAHDLERLAYNEHQSMEAAGMGPGDTVLLTCTMDRCFVAGLAYFLGTRSVGAAAVRNGHAGMESHAEIINRVSPTVIIGVPSFLHKLALYLQESGYGASCAPVRKLICIGEPVRDRHMGLLPMGSALKELWGASLHSTYASSETVATFCECTSECGGHLHPELAVVEVLDEDGEGVAPGREGELVITPLGVEGMPLVRFRTGDIAFLMDESCGCGRNSPRIGPILARRKQMIKLKGTTLYPQSIALALGEIAAVQEHYIEVGRVSDLSDTVTVHVAVSDPDWDAQKIARKLQSRLRVRPEVVVRTAEEIRRQVFSPLYRKPMRFVDRRV